MKSRPRIGEVGELAIPTDMKHAVEFAGNGMPAVVSTPHLVGFLERTARETIAACLEADERSVGIELDIRHLAPTPVGPTIHCRAQVIAVENRKVTFQIEARDQHEVIVRGHYLQPAIQSGSQGWGLGVTDGSDAGGMAFVEGSAWPGHNLWFQEGIIPVPEPSSALLALFGSGILLLAFQ